MSSNFEKLLIKTWIKDFYDLTGPVQEIISQLSKLEAEYPGCYVTNTYDEYDLWWDRLETDEEYAERMLRLQAKEAAKLTRKRAQYEQLKKELGLDDEKA